MIFLFHNFDSNIAITFQAFMPYISICKFLEGQECCFCISCTQQKSMCLLEDVRLSKINLKIKVVTRHFLK